MRVFVHVVICLLLLSACGEEEPTNDKEEGFILECPCEVTLSAEQALIATTGEILPSPDFLRADLVTFKNNGIKLNTGAKESLPHCQPMHICRASERSKPQKYSSLEEVCMQDPVEGEGCAIPLVEPLMGFTIRLNTANGCAKFWVKDVTGVGDDSKVTLVYSFFHMGLAD